MLPKFFRREIDTRVDERINEILHSNVGDDFTLRQVSGEEARREISSFILRKKAKGITRLSTLDFVLSLRIPPTQVEDVLEDFKKEQKVTEVYG